MELHRAARSTVLTLVAPAQPLLHREHGYGVITDLLHVDESNEQKRGLQKSQHNVQVEHAKWAAVKRQRGGQSAARAKKTRGPHMHPPHMGKTGQQQGGNDAL